MNKNSTWLWLISLALIFLTIISTLCVGNDNSDNDSKYDYEPPDQELEKLYLSENYLLPQPPSHDSNNKTELLAQNRTIFGHNIRDRKFNNKITPELNLWINSHGRSGIELEFEIVFQAVEDNTLLPHKTFKILFENYTTNGSTENENLMPAFIKYDGKYFDIQYGNENWSSIYLKIQRTDNFTDTIVDIYFGSEQKVSYIKIPYDKTLSFYEYEKEKEEENQATPGFTAIQVVLVLGILISIFYLRGSLINSQKK